MSRITETSVEGERTRLEMARTIAQSEKRLNIKVTPGQLIDQRVRASDRLYYRLSQWLLRNYDILVCRRTIVENISIGFCNSNLEDTKFKIYLKVYGHHGNCGKWEDDEYF